MTVPALTFLGAAGTVTGSRFLVEADEAHSAARLAERIGSELGWCAVVPSYGERVPID